MKKEIVVDLTKISTYDEKAPVPNQIVKSPRQTPKFTFNNQYAPNFSKMPHISEQIVSPSR